MIVCGESTIYRIPSWFCLLEMIVCGDGPKPMWERTEIEGGGECTMYCYL